MAVRRRRPLRRVAPLVMIPMLVVGAGPVTSAAAVPAVKSPPISLLEHLHDPSAPSTPPPAAPAQAVAAAVPTADSIHPVHVPRHRVVLIGDSMVFNLCADVAGAECVTYPGGWVASINGENLTDEFVTKANLSPGDAVVLSSIGGFHSAGVDDAVILARLSALYDRLVSIGVRLIVLVAPAGGFPICTQEFTPQAEALFGDRRDELCATGRAIADLERSWPVTEFDLDGPYVEDNLHQTDAARQALAELIEAAL